MLSMGDKRDYLERIFICMMCKFQHVWLMHVGITIVLVKLVFPSLRRFQNGTKSSDEVLCKIKEILS
jgi:hypothetical protein